VPLLYWPDVYRAVVQAVGAEKLLFGSDYPLLIYPRRTRIPGFGDLLAEMRSSGLGAEQLSLILGGNIKKLLGL
jgi:predicted TIM-barrel fold metal-dependent hydrolase